MIISTSPFDLAELLIDTATHLHLKWKMQNGQKSIQRTIANFQQKVDLQEQLLSTYRYQLEKQKDEIAGLKITIETQRDRTAI